MERKKYMETNPDLRLSLNINENNVKQIPPENKKLKLSFCRKFKLVMTNITVEPMMICYVIPIAMGSLASQNLSLEKACRVNLKLNESICDALSARNSSGYRPSDEIAVQRAVSTLIAYKNILQSLLPTFLLMFIGSWSDRHNRRKPCIMLPIFGEVLCSIGQLICTYYFYELSMEYNLIAEGIPPCLTGGWAVLILGVYSYIGTLSTIEERTVRIGAVSVFCEVSMTVGISLSGVLYKQTGFYGVFGISLAMFMIGLIYGHFRITELPIKQLEDAERIISTETDERKNFCADFFDLKHIRETFAVAFKTNEKKRRKRICVIFLLVMVVIGPAYGENNVKYLFVRYKFGWDEMDFSIYNTFNFISCCIGVIVSLWFVLKFLKADDTILGIISGISRILACLIYAFAPNGTIFYLGALVEAWNATSFIALRSIASKLVPPNELGKINSLYGIFEALIPMAFGPLFSFVYNYTLEWMPGAFQLLSAILTVPSIIIFYWLYKEHQRDAKEEAEAKDHKEKLLQMRSLAQQNCC